MSSSYDSSLPSDKDWVRFLTGDTDVTNPSLQDEEILAVITEESIQIGPSGAQALKYFASAMCLERILSGQSLAGEGVESIKVGSLTITQGISSSGVSSVQAKISQLRLKGASLLGSKPRVFRLL